MISEDIIDRQFSHILTDARAGGVRDEEGRKTEEEHDIISLIEMSPRRDIVTASNASHQQRHRCQVIRIAFIIVPWTSIASPLLFQ